jgi:dienelactone hydrolase
VFALIAIAVFGFVVFKNGFFDNLGTVATSRNPSKSCKLVQPKGVSGEVYYCSSEKSGIKQPVIIATGGYSSTAKGTRDVCGFFVGNGFACLALDSANFKINRNEEDVVADIVATVEYTKNLPAIDAAKIILWGGSNGALTSLMAASGRSDIAAVAALSPPLIHEYDKDGNFAELAGFNSNLIYIYGEDDFTDAETAGNLCAITKKRGKLCETVMIHQAGHEICCNNPPLLKKQAEFILNFGSK